MSKPSGRCIFCGGSGMSKEHVFPDWLREVFSSSASDTHTEGVFNFLDLEDFDATQPTLKKRQGQASTRKVRVVCETCNNGWMSRLENEAKPLLKRLIDGEQFVLGPDEQRLLAAWAAKTTMTGEFLMPGQIAILAEQRKFLMDNGVPPTDGWWVTIAAHEAPEWVTAMHHFSTRINLSLADLRGAGVANTQCTTIGLGRLLIQVISTTVKGADFSLRTPDRSQLKQVWPRQHPSVTWPTSPPIDGPTADGIARNMTRALLAALKERSGDGG